ATASPSRTAKQEGPKPAGLIDDVLASGTNFGYRFTYVPGKADAHGIILTYTTHADPVTPGVTGDHYYFTDESDVIRSAIGKEADSGSLPIGDGALITGESR
ncbi:MAG: hypothetical protein ACRD1N_03700, partial [Terriglobia bacterium]